jgi:DNA polymerase-3 subunit alpha
LQIIEDKEFNVEEILEYENELLGIYVSGHPLGPFRPILNKLTGVGSLKRGGGRVTVAGMISDLKVFTTKKGDRMCRFKLEDFTGRCDVIVFPKSFLSYEEIIGRERLFIITGNISEEDGAVKILADKVAVLNDELSKQLRAIRFYLPVEQSKESELDNLKHLILEHRGTIPVEIIFTSKGGRAKMKLGDNYMVAPTAAFLSKSADLFGDRLDLVKEE